jgi:hypothetical protein
MSDLNLPPQAPDEESGAEQRRFDDLTLAEVVEQFLQAPSQTLRSLREVANAPRAGRGPEMALVTVRRRGARSSMRVRDGLDANRRAALQLGLRLTAFVIAWWGCGILANTPQRTETTALDNGAPFLLTGFLLWLAAEIFGDWPRIQAWWARRMEPAHSVRAEAERDSTLLVDSENRQSLGAGAQRDAPTRHNAKSASQAAWGGLNPSQALAGLGGLFLSFIALRFTENNTFTTIGFWSWLFSILLWLIALAPPGNGPLQWAQTFVADIRRVRWRSGTMIALAAILLLGAAFRLSNLDGVPPEMTSDHVEKVLDSYGVLHGQHNVFFANNGGREPFQMYAMAVIAQLPGLGFNHYTLKLLSAVEGLIAIVMIFWMGREVIGEENRRFGTIVGLVLAALVAASYWHTALSRLGLRIVLTTVITAALLTFLARAIRHNRRVDFIKAGIVLGFGLYTYQAVRMLPVVIVVGVGLALLFHTHNWRERGRYVLNLSILVMVALVIFVPLLGYWMQYPNDFWRRTEGRLLGDDLITATNEDGSIVERQATLGERLEAFSQNLPILTNNIRTALLMFNWKGDVAWINGAPNQPAMDTFTGALLIVGLAAWLARMVRRRDVFDWLVPLAVLIMLMPSALSIAYPVENPSHTRTSGALPEVYLIAALPLALLVRSITEIVPGRRGAVTAVGLVMLIVLGAYNANTRTYFVGHYDAYMDSSYPYSEAGQVLRGFADSDGAFGNAFMIGFPHWWDHRALGIDAGRPDWPNGIVSMNALRDILFTAAQKTDDFRLDPDKDLLFFLSPDDDDSLAVLQQNFPTGRMTLRQSYQPDDQYRLYRVPALGADKFLRWLAGN